MLKVTVKDSSLKETHLEINQEKSHWSIASELFDGDVVKIRDNQYHVIWKNRSFSIDVIESDFAGKSFKLLINGQLFTTSAKDEFDLLLEGLGMQAGASQKINHVKAPMPGLIQSVAINVGDEVEKGDTLLVLVAMKMENAIRATGGGIVKSMKIVPGQIVEKGQVLLEFQ